MNISVLSIHFVNYFALNYVSHSFPSVQIIFLLHFESLSLQTAAAAAAHNQRLYFAFPGKKGVLLDVFILLLSFLYLQPG